ncbi:MAG: helix-turn-helix transcriptional regulator [Bdellovibrionaceae bacterium]|nr:helix-turn-helix transcriptional regulator [Pseudobdellovibrionaceae bacterium]
MARNFSHPSMKDLTIDGVLHALSDPIRREIVKKLASCQGMSCTKSCASGLPPSTISFHHKVLRENGLIRSKKVGVEVINTLRKLELDKKFPGLLDSILKHHR